MVGIAMQALSDKVSGSSVSIIPKLRGGTCGNPGMKCLPGVDTLGAGFDIVRGTGVGLQQVIMFSYDSQRTYMNPFNSTLIYAVPDNVTVRDHTGSSSSVSTSTFYSSKEYAKSLAYGVSASVSGSVYGNAFSASSSVSQASSALSSSSAFGSYAVSSKTITLYDVILPPSGSIHTTPQFESAWNNLPSIFDATNATNVAIFNSFFSYFGTHYVESSVFGGMGTMSTAVNKEYASSHDSAQTNAEADMHFLWVTASGSGGSSHNDSSSDFNKASHFSASIIGGDPTLSSDLTNWNAWLPTFYNAPAQVSYKVRELSALINDPVIATAVDNALTAYAGGLVTDNCTWANEQIAGLQRKLTNGPQTWSFRSNAASFAHGLPVSFNPGAVFGVFVSYNGIFTNGGAYQYVTCYFKIYDTSTEPLLKPKFVHSPAYVNQFGKMSQISVTYPTEFGAAMDNGIYVQLSQSLADGDSTPCKFGNDIVSVTVLYK